MQLTIQRTGELVDSYTARLNNNLRYAWSAAYQATKDDQGKRVADAIRQTPGSVTTYKEGDRVARKLYGAANKLEYLYAGPYRIDEVLPNGRYKLRDLENGNIFDELEASNLRPYRTPTEGGELAKDEFIVERLLGRRTKQGGRRVEYEVKWRGYPKSQSTWEPRSALELRCNELLEAYDEEHHVAPSTNGLFHFQGTTTPNTPSPAPAPPATSPGGPAELTSEHGMAAANDAATQPETMTPNTPSPALAPPATSPGGPAELKSEHGMATTDMHAPNDEHDTGTETARNTTDQPPSTSVSPNDGLPHAAAPASKGKWLYKVYVGKGPKERWKPSENFTPEELQSTHFQNLRNQALRANMVAAAKWGEERGSVPQPAARRLPFFEQTRTTRVAVANVPPRTIKPLTAYAGPTSRDRAKPNA